MEKNKESGCSCASDAAVGMKFMINVGRAYDRLEAISQLSVFEDLSKHNSFWSSEHEKENEKLYDLRLKLQVLEEALGEALSFLEVQE